MQWKKHLAGLGLIVLAGIIIALLWPNIFGNNGANNDSIVGTWVAGDSTLTFNANGTYTQTVQNMVFDTGTYTTSGGQCTMTSRGGNTGTGSYQVSGKTLTGLSDSSGKPAIYQKAE